MSNPYKKIVEKLMCKFPYLMDEKCEWYCRFCKVTPEEDHLQNCLYLQAKTLIDQDPDINEDNPWILCSERLPTEDGEYDVTVLEYNALDVYVDKFEDGRWVNQLQRQVVAWKKRPEPCRPPNYEDIGKIYPLEKTLEPTPDPLMGWAPLGMKGIPNPYNKLVRFLYSINGVLVPLVGFQDDFTGVYYLYFNLRYPTEVEAKDVIAWKYFDHDELPSLDKFQKGHHE